MALTTITSAGIADGAITSADIADGAITNADINASAAIATTKISGTFTSFRSTGIDDNADALAITISSAEKVGLGVTDPDEVLEVNGAIHSGNRIDIYKGGNVTKSGTMGANDDIGLTGLNASDFVIKTTEATSAFGIATSGASDVDFCIADSGNVGIATTTPGKELEVVGDLRLGFGAAMSNEYGKSVYFSTDASPVDVASLRMKEHTSDNYGLELQTFSGSLATRMTVLGDGKVGIGQTVPTGLLHVKSAGASTTPFRVERSGGSGDELAVNMQGDNRMWVQMYQAGTEKIRFDVGSPSFITDKLTIGSNTTATTTLLVSGDVKTTGQAYFADTTLSFDATQDWNLSTNQVCTLTLTANTTFDAPTNMVDGAFYSILMIQDGTGSRTASWNAVFKWAAATAPVLTTTAAAKDIFVFRSDGTNMYEVGRQLNVS